MTEPQTVSPHFAWLLRGDPVARLIACGFGTGLSPKAPGTAGTVLAVFLSGLILGLGASQSLLFLLAVIVFFIGLYVCRIVERDLGVHDHRAIVVDEIAAMMLILACIPQGFFSWLGAFVVFRFFDAVKPQPIRWFDRHVHGALGVMLDDIIAAIMSIVVLGLWQWL